MLRKLGKDVAIYGGADLLFKLAGFVVIPLYAHAFSVDLFGRMATITVTATLLGYVVNLGVNNAMHRFYFDHETAEDQRPLIVSTGLLQLCCSALIVVGLAFALAAGLKEEIHRDYGLEWIWVALALANVVPEQIAQYTLDAVRLHFTPWRFFIIALVKNLAGILLGLWFLLVWDLGLTGIFLGTLVASSAAVPLGLWMIRKDLTWRPDPGVGRAMFRYGYPFVFTSAAYWVFGSMDRWLLMEMSSAEEVGLFSVAFKFAAILTFVIGAFSQAWSPYAMKMMREAPDYRRTYASIFSVWYFLLAVAGLVVALFAREVMVLTTPPPYWPAAPILSVGAAGMVLFGTTQITALGITLEKRTMLLTAGAWMAAIVNIALNFVLIPRFGAMGSAVATLFAYATLTGSFLVWTQRIHPLPLEVGKLFYCSLIVIVAALAPLAFADAGVDPAVLAAKTSLVLIVILGAVVVQIVPRDLAQRVMAQVRG